MILVALRHTPCLNGQKNKSLCILSTKSKQKKKKTKKNNWLFLISIIVTVLLV